MDKTAYDRFSSKEELEFHPEAESVSFTSRMAVLYLAHRWVIGQLNL